MDLNTVLLLATVSGYGDVVDDYPSYEERAVHLWTNAARSDPQAFDEEYQTSYDPCTFTIDFQSEERIPKAPLYYTPPLNESARFHSEDMRDNDWFDHNSSDGTPMGTRVGRFYTESSTVGENIAMGYPSAYEAVFKGWMCSSGHRANIMSPTWNELGTGVAGSYYTQNFGAGSADSDSPIRMGLHEPKKPGSGESTTFWADYEGTDLVGLEVWVDGRGHSMDLEYGEAEMGIYVAEVKVGKGACSQYYFIVEDAQGRTLFPEEGSYLAGSECREEWVEGHLGTDLDLDPDEMTDDIYLIGCSSLDRGAQTLGVLALMGLALLRRR